MAELNTIFSTRASVQLSLSHIMNRRSFLFKLFGGLAALPLAAKSCGVFIKDRHGALLPIDEKCLAALRAARLKELRKEFDKPKVDVIGVWCFEWELKGGDKVIDYYVQESIPRKGARLIFHVPREAGKPISLDGTCSRNIILTCENGIWISRPPHVRLERFDGFVKGKGFPLLA